MPKRQYQYGDVGSPVGLTVKRADGNVESDLGSATTLEIVFVPPSSGEPKTKTAVLVTDGADGKMEYISEADFFDETGTWHYHGHIVIGSGDWLTNVNTLDVMPNAAQL